MKPSPRRNPSRRRHLIVVLFSLFQKGPRPEDVADELSQTDDADPGFGRIRCPLCKWRPTRSSLWFCGDCWRPEGLLEGCGAVWNTFDTRGRCPGCGHQWRWTSCLSCWGWSLHEEWYEKEKD